MGLYIIIYNGNIHFESGGLDELPQNFALGRNEQGEWCTTKLKEYPPAIRHHPMAAAKL
jgi:hypothetical protein